MSNVRDFKSEGGSSGSGSTAKPAYRTQYDMAYAVTSQKGVDPQGGDQPKKAIQHVAEHIAQVIKDNATTYHFNPQNNYNIGILIYSVLGDDNKPSNRAIVALSGENKADKIAEAIRAKQGIAALVGSNPPLSVDLVTSTGNAARYYGYGTGRKNFFIAALPDEKEDLRPGTFYFAKGDNSQLVYAKKESNRVQKKTLALDLPQQAILLAYVNATPPAEEQLEALQEIIINHRDNKSTYKCSEPKLAAERQKLLLFSHGFMDEGENHFAASSDKVATVTPQCSCSECQSRIDQFQKPLETLANVRMLLNITGQDEKKANQSSPLAHTKEIDQPLTTDANKQKQASALFNEAIKLYTSQDPKAIAPAAKKWAQAMLLAGDTHEGNGLQSKFIKMGGLHQQESRVTQLRNLAIEWFKQEGDYHFDNQKDNYRYQKVLAFYKQLIPLLESRKALTAPKPSANTSAATPSDTELSLYYMKRAYAQLKEVEMLGDENINRKALMDASKKDYHAALLEGLNPKDLAKDPMWIKIQVEYCCQLGLHTEPALSLNLATLVSNAIALNKDEHDLYIYQALIGKEKNVDGLVMAIKKINGKFTNPEQSIHKFLKIHQLKPSESFNQLLNSAIEKINQDKKITKIAKEKQKEEEREKKRVQSLQEEAKREITIKEKNIEIALTTFSTEINRYEIIYNNRLKELTGKALGLQNIEIPKAQRAIEKETTQSKDKLITALNKLCPEINLQELKKKI